MQSMPRWGTCVNVGCVPKKLMTRRHFLHDVHDARVRMDVPQAPQLQWSRFIDNKVAPMTIAF